jgi:hypothetical protein
MIVFTRVFRVKLVGLARFEEKERARGGSTLEGPKLKKAVVNVGRVNVERRHSLLRGFLRWLAAPANHRS